MDSSATKLAPTLDLMKHDLRFFGPLKLELTDLVRPPPGLPFGTSDGSAKPALSQPSTGGRGRAAQKRSVSWTPTLGACCGTRTLGVSDANSGAESDAQAHRHPPTTRLPRQQELVHKITTSRDQVGTRSLIRSGQPVVKCWWTGVGPTVPSSSSIGS